MERLRVETGSDTIASFAAVADPVDALAELIWNGLDAEASRVDVGISEGGLGGVEEIVVRDDGHGMTYSDARQHFRVDGESWKKERRFSPNTNRPLHGQHGRGRFLSYRLAQTIRWTTIAEVGDGREVTEIVGRLDRPNEFEVEGPTATELPTGTVVTISCQQDPKLSNKLSSDSFPDQLRARLAPALRAMTDAAVRLGGTVLDPSDGVVAEHDVPLELDDEALAGHPAPRLIVTEWERNTAYRHLLLCDEAGAVVTDTKVDGIGTPPFHWTAYLLWDGFRDPELMGPADLHVPELKHRRMFDAVAAAMRNFFAGEVERRRGALVAQWKLEGAYPYMGEPSTPAESLERDLFDVVAVVASPGLGRTVKQKRLTLGLLKEGVAHSSAETRKLLAAVLDLPESEQQVLSELLERTSLGSIVRATRTVTDRLDFVRGLGDLLYADETRRTFREVDQLHPMVAQEPWIFGDEWTDTLTESGLTRLVKTTLEREDRVFAPTPVRLPDGRGGRVDLALYRQLPESEGARHLVVELKRSSVTLSMEEYSQVANYATTITRHPEVALLPHKWDFWLVGTAYDATVADHFIDSSRPGLAIDRPGYRLWVVSWSELLGRAERRLEAFRSQLDIASSSRSATKYLARAHAAYLPTSGLPEDESDGGGS